MPFEVAHAVGNVVFALIAGPAMVRMLVRFRERFEWRRRGGARPRQRLAPRLRGGVAARHRWSLALRCDRRRAQAPTPTAPSSWLLSVQNADGGFGASPGRRIRRRDDRLGDARPRGRRPQPARRRPRRRTPVDYLRANVDELSSPGDLARTILALEGAGVDPRSFGGIDLVSALLEQRRDEGPRGLAGLDRLRGDRPARRRCDGGLEKALSWLRQSAEPGRGLGRRAGRAQRRRRDRRGDAGAMPDSEISKRGLGYLRNHQRTNGGFATGAPGASTRSRRPGRCRGPRCRRRGRRGSPRLPRRAPGGGRPLPLLRPPATRRQSG